MSDEVEVCAGVHLLKSELDIITLVHDSIHGGFIFTITEKYLLVKFVGIRVLDL